MSADLLLQYFERICDTPGAVARLRWFTLNLAVRGKLVAQDPKDEPASELLKRVALEKSQLVRDGEIRQNKPPAPADAGVLPFELRAGWCAATIEHVVLELQTGPFGSALHQSDYHVGGTPVINPASIQNGRIVPIEKMAVGTTTVDRLSNFKLSKGDIVMARRGEMGRCAVITEREAGWLCGTGSLVLRLPHCVYAEFLALLIGSPYVRQHLGNSAVGATMQNLNQAILLKLGVALPPLAEQHRIVAKVNEVMALCDRLDAARAKREATRDRLRASSLGRLSAPGSNTFQDDARFALDVLPALTTRADEIKELRQTIFGLAVCGKLSPQDSKDEPASELLKRIAVERQHLNLKQRLARSAAGSIPFQLPDGWCWSTVGQVCTKTGSGSTPRGGKAVYKAEGIPFIRSQNVYDDGLRMSDVAYIDVPTHTRMRGSAVKPGDLLLNITGGSMGRCSRVGDAIPEANVSQHVAILRPAIPGIDGFLHCLVRSPYFQAFIFDKQTGAGRGGLPKNRMDRIVVALPPLAEQHRINAKVGELLALCDELESNLATSDSTRRRLLEALLAEALAAAKSGATVRQMKGDSH